MSIKNLLLLLFVLIGTLAIGQPRRKLQQLQPYHSSVHAQFGWSSAIANDFIALGSLTSNVEFGGTMYEEAGMINIYKHHPEYGWIFHQNIISPRPEHFDFFGDQIVMKDDLLVIASPGYSQRRNQDHTHRTGAVFLYTLHDGYWTHIATIFEPIPNANAQFGDCLSLSENTLLISSYHHKENGVLTQAMYAFDVSMPAKPSLIDTYTFPHSHTNRLHFAHWRNNIIASASSREFEWMGLESNRLILRSKQTVRDSYISSLAINGEWISIGIHEDFYGFYSVPGNLMTDSILILPPSAGENYVLNTPESRAKHSISSAEFSARAIPYIPWDTYQREKQSIGQVEVYRYASDTLLLFQTLTASDGASDDWFGSRMALRDSTLLITSLGDAVGPEEAWSSRFAGAVYLFQYQDEKWIELEKITLPDLKAWDKFGFSLGLSDHFGVIGIRLRDTAHRNTTYRDSGAGVVFRR
ncbi:MAG: hypothetical protein EP346_11365 [Bacteroidetes bacterium]|nr:MAG: hypothetical protein EP346_11365 [Bacteroidota bacterium]